MTPQQVIDQEIEEMEREMNTPRFKELVSDVKRSFENGPKKKHRGH
jgi:hypothetical protein